MNKYEIAVRIARKLQTGGFSAYFVGGAVRNMILGRKMKDIDIVTSARPDQINSIFPRTYNIGASFGIVNVVENDVNFDVATFRKESGYNDGRHPERIVYTEDPFEDSNRRDFTINAIFYDPHKDEYLDFHEGRRDLEKGVLRTIGDPVERFTEDYLRMLRAVRIATELGFTIDGAIIEAIKEMSCKTSELSSERIRDELTRMFTGPSPDDALQMLYDSGILQVVLPEIAAMRGISQPKEYHPEGDVFEHTRIMLRKMPMPSPELAWAVLLHDVGKPVTQSIDENGVEHFYLHPERGCHMAREILQRLKFPSAFTENVSYAVKNHMRFAEVNNMRVSKRRSMIASPIFPMELELHRLDCISSNGIISNFIFLIDEIIRQSGHRELPPPLITGQDLLSIGIPQGPEIGRILKDVREKQMEGELKSKSEAMKYARLKWP